MEAIDVVVLGDEERFTEHYGVYDVAGPERLHGMGVQGDQPHPVLTPRSLTHIAALQPAPMHDVP